MTGVTISKTINTTGISGLIIESLDHHPTYTGYVEFPAQIELYGVCGYGNSHSSSFLLPLLFKKEIGGSVGFRPSIYLLGQIIIQFLLNYWVVNKQTTVLLESVWKFYQSCLSMLFSFFICKQKLIAHTVLVVHITNCIQFSSPHLSNKLLNPVLQRLLCWIFLFSSELVPNQIMGWHQIHLVQYVPATF